MSNNAKNLVTHELRFKINGEFLPVSGLFTNTAKNGSTYLGISGKSIDSEKVAALATALGDGAAIEGVYVMPVGSKEA